MIILIDIGNTNITIGIADEEKIKHVYSLKSIVNKTADEYYLSFKAMISCVHVKACVISSVVPGLTATLSEMSRKYFLCEPLLFSSGIKTSLMIKTDNPKEVGSDLIADAVGSFEYGDEVLTIDLGTATKFVYCKKIKATICIIK